MNATNDMKTALATARARLDVDAERKKIERKIASLARRATGITPLSAADERAGRDRDWYAAECERLTALVREHRERARAARAVGAFAAGAASPVTH